MTVGWVYSPFFLRHDTGRDHPECPERLTAILGGLSDEGLLEQLHPLLFEPAPAEILGWVHEPAYVDLVRLACENGMPFIGDSDTRISAESYEVAQLAVGGVLRACDAVMAGEARRVFCAVRPPGHHAERDRAMGYCLFNNVAIAAEYLLRRHSLRRVAIVDWDVHHGNGTQSLFEHRRDVLFVSVHESPDTQYPHTGRAHEVGRGAGAGFTLNVPVRWAGRDAHYRRAFDEQILPALDRFAPELILISAGFDAAREDRSSNILLEPSSFAWMTRDLLAVAARHGRGRLVSVLEGGYDLWSLPRCVAAHVRALLDDCRS